MKSPFFQLSIVPAFCVMLLFLLMYTAVPSSHAPIISNNVTRICISAVAGLLKFFRLEDSFDRLQVNNPMNLYLRINYLLIYLFKFLYISNNNKPHICL